jgi:hypothetical protein
MAGHVEAGVSDAAVRIVRMTRTAPVSRVTGTAWGAPAAIERAIAASGIPRSEFTADPLAEFVRRFEEKSGQVAVLATHPVPPEAETG